MRRIKLTSAQYSALDCAGADLPVSEDEHKLAAAWRGMWLEFETSDANAIWSAIVDLGNGEDAHAEDRSEDADRRRHSRGAALALGNLSSKVLT